MQHPRTSKQCLQCGFPRMFRCNERGRPLYHHISWHNPMSKENCEKDSYPNPSGLWGEQWHSFLPAQTSRSVSEAGTSAVPIRPKCKRRFGGKKELLCASATCEDRRGLHSLRNGQVFALAQWPHLDARMQPKNLLQRLPTLTPSPAAAAVPAATPHAHTFYVKRPQCTSDIEPLAAPVQP